MIIVVVSDDGSIAGRADLFRDRLTVRTSQDTKRRILRAPDRDVRLAVTVEVTCNRRIRWIPKLRCRNRSVNTALDKPCRALRPEDGKVGLAVAVIVVRYRNVALLAELDGRKVVRVDVGFVIPGAIR